MSEIDKENTKDSWFRRYLGVFFILFITFSHEFVEDWINYQNYSIIGLFCFVNLSFFLNRKKDENKTSFRNNWIKINLIAIGAIPILFFVVLPILSKLFDGLIEIVPATVFSILSSIIILFLFCYVIGFGLHFVKKSSKL